MVVPQLAQQIGTDDDRSVPPDGERRADEVNDRDAIASLAKRQRLLDEMHRRVGPCSEQDIADVTALLERKPKSAFSVIVRRVDGVPVVTKNAPFERDGTPMPTLFWLLPSAVANDAIGRLEASGGVRAVERALGLDAIDAIHKRYAAERNALIPDGWIGPLPSGGVGGTRRGCKCLHAHYAYFLSGADDEVGEWVEAHLDMRDRDNRAVRSSLDPHTNFEGNP